MRHGVLLLPLAHSPTRLCFLQPPSRAMQGTPVPLHQLCCDKEGQGPLFCNKQCILMALVLQEGGRSLRRSWFTGCEPRLEEWGVGAGEATPKSMWGMFSLCGLTAEETTAQNKNSMVMLAIQRERNTKPVPFEAETGHVKCHSASTTRLMLEKGL